MGSFDSDPNDLDPLMKRYLEDVKKFKREKERRELAQEMEEWKKRRSRRLVMSEILMDVSMASAVAAFSIHLLDRCYNVHHYNKLKVIYNNDPALESLKQAVQGKMSQFSSAYNQASKQSPYSKLNNTDGDVTIAIRSDSMAFTQDFRDGPRQIEVVVSTNFLQSCPIELLANEFIQRLKMRLMQTPTENNSKYSDMPVIRIF